MRKQLEKKLKRAHKEWQDSLLGPTRFRIEKYNWYKLLKDLLED